MQSSTMQFSLLNAVRNHPDHAYPLADVYADYISDAVLAEELGFTRSWYGEHHFRPCQWTGSPMLVASAVAARTSTLRVGSAVALLPFHDPRRLAEDAAILDIDLRRPVSTSASAPGSQFEEFRTFGIDPSEMIGRSWESIDWIRRAFTEPGEFSHARPLLRHPRHDLHHQAGAEPGAGVVGRDGPGRTCSGQPNGAST